MVDQLDNLEQLLVLVGALAGLYMVLGLIAALVEGGSKVRRLRRMNERPHMKDVKKRG